MVLRPSQVRQMLEDDGLPVNSEPSDEGDDAPRQSYNFAPGYQGLIYRADVQDGGAVTQSKLGEAPEESLSASIHDETNTKYKLQSMKWGLVPSWTKHSPQYANVLKTINCRDDSLSSPGGMWATMKTRKRCIVLAQGFFEWLKVGERAKVPHYVKRKDGRLMCFAGLWDSVQYQGSQDTNYTYTIITTSSNKELKFLHSRMPVIIDQDSTDVQTWLDSSRCQWSPELQSLLRPYDGELIVYPVSQEVGKVGNNEATFILPRDRKENKNNIMNFLVKVKKEG